MEDIRESMKVVKDNFGGCGAMDGENVISEASVEERYIKIGSGGNVYMGRQVSHFTSKTDCFEGITATFTAHWKGCTTLPTTIGCFNIRVGKNKIGKRKY